MQDRLRICFSVANHIIYELSMKFIRIFLLENIDIIIYLWYNQPAKWNKRGGMKMNIKEAVRVIGENIPEPYNKMVDRRHIKLVLAWYKFLEEFERLERDNAELLKGNINEISGGDYKADI